MANVRRMKAIAEAAIKRLDPGAITEGNFYDDASGRLFVTIFKGTRKVSVALREQDFDNGAERMNRAIADGVRRLAETPIG
ncbi:MAG TPA: hypothetical protein VLM38_09785 [Blastocatellia bacterium]|nr:hypothetical protein [Blastocatellia bacterium]